MQRLNKKYSFHIQSANKRCFGAFLPLNVLDPSTQNMLFWPNMLFWQSMLFRRKNVFNPYHSFLDTVLYAARTKKVIFNYYFCKCTCIEQYRQGYHFTDDCTKSLLYSNCAKACLFIYQIINYYIQDRIHNLTLRSLHFKSFRSSSQSQPL